MRLKPITLIIFLYFFSGYFTNILFSQTDSTKIIDQISIDSLNQVKDSIIDAESQKRISKIEENSLFLATPYDAIYLHYSYLQKSNYNPLISSRAFYLNDTSKDNAKSLAIKLMRIYNGNGLVLRFDLIPRNPNYKDTITGKSKYVLFEKFPQIYLEKIGDLWLYSEETVKLIPDLYDSTFPIDFYALEDSIPDFMLFELIGVRIWKIIGFLILLFVGYLLFYFFNWIFGFLIVKIISKINLDIVANKLIKPIAKPLSMLLITGLLIGLMPSFHLPFMVNYYVLLILNILIPVFITLIFYKLTDLIGDILSKIASKTKSKVDDQLVPLARKSIKVIVIVFGCLYVLKTLDVDITPLIAGVSIGGLAFALAAQETIKNLFGSITIFTDQPFVVGDWIVIEGIEGNVEEVGMRSTRIRTFYNSVISIPNGRLADMTIDNMGARNYRRFRAEIGITYDTSPELIDVFVEGLKEIVVNHPKTRKDVYAIYLNSFGSSSINILFNIFFIAEDISEELQSRQEILLDIISLAHELEVRFAFPTNTIHIETFSEKQSLIPLNKGSKEGFIGKMRNFFKSKEKNHREIDE